MSSAVKTKPLTAAQRTSAAVQGAANVLGLDDVKRLGVALTLAAEEALHNSSFAARVCALYEELAPRKTAPAKPSSKTAAPDVELIPVKSMEGYYLDPAAPPDPYFLLEFYGAHQLELALQRYTAPPLRYAVKVVQARHPKTKPTGASKQALIDYIVQQIGA